MSLATKAVPPARFLLYEPQGGEGLMQAIFLVFLGGGLGAILRHGVNLASGRLWGVAFPFGTLSVNIVGSFAMGLLIAWFVLRSDESTTQALRLFWATGVLGGFTTFSAFSLDSVLLWERGEALLAAGYVAASVMGSILALMAGFALVRAVA
jgi:CrcB protein